MSLNYHNVMHPGKRRRGHHGYMKFNRPQKQSNAFGQHMVGLITDSLEPTQLNPILLGEQIAPMIHQMTNKLSLDPMALSKQIVKVLSAKTGKYVIDPITLGTEYKLIT